MCFNCIKRLYGSFGRSVQKKVVNPQTGESEMQFELEEGGPGRTLTV